MMDTAIQMFNDWVTDLKEYPPHAWLNDPREPLFTFTLWDGREFGFYAMSLTYWIEICFVRLSCFARLILPNIWPNLWMQFWLSITQVLAFEGILAAAFAQLVYRFIVPNKNTTFAYLIGYGFIIPFWMAFPVSVVNFIDVKNKVFRFCICAVTPALCTFRTTEGE